MVQDHAYSDLKTHFYNVHRELEEGHDKFFYFDFVADFKSDN